MARHLPPSLMRPRDRVDIHARPFSGLNVLWCLCGAPVAQRGLVLLVAGGEARAASSSARDEARSWGFAGVSHC